MDQSALDLQLRKLERAAQSALSGDASFLEVLQALRREVDEDARVRAAMRALRHRGLSVYCSFVPRVHVWLNRSAEVAPTGEIPLGNVDPRTQELHDVASAVIAASVCSRQLAVIVNEATQASNTFERLAEPLERIGLGLHICLDLSMYTQVREPAARPVLSRDDLDFLKELKISPR